MECKHWMQTEQCKVGLDLTEGGVDPMKEHLLGEIDKSRKIGRCEKDYENCPAYQEWEKRERIFKSA